MFFKKIKKLEEENKKLKNEIIKLSTQNNIILGVVSAFTDKDLELLKKQSDAIKLILKYLSYQIALRTDMIRNLNDGQSIEEKIGYVNALHHLYLFFYKLDRKVEERDIGINLI